jgi:hypothetical protein
MRTIQRSSDIGQRAHRQPGMQNHAGSMLEARACCAELSLEARKSVKQIAKTALNRLPMSLNLRSRRSNARDYTCEVCRSAGYFLLPECGICLDSSVIDKKQDLGANLGRHTGKNAPLLPDSIDCLPDCDDRASSLWSPCSG